MVGIGEISAWLTDKSREFIPETRGSILEAQFTPCWKEPVTGIHTSYFVEKMMYIV